MVQQTVAVEENTLAVWREGSGSPVVLVHGWLCDHQDNTILAAQLASDHEVVMLDLRGHGESEDKHGGFGLVDFAADVIGVVEQLQLDQVILVGHSMGAGVVLEAARLAPHLVRGVLLIDSRWAFTSATQEQLDSIPTLLGDAYFPRRATMDGLRRKVLPDIAIGPPSQAVAAASYESLLTWPGQAALRDCPVPVYAVVADQHAPLMAAAQLAVPALTIELISGTGHWVHVEEPEKVAASVRRFEAALN
jgi:pimeloyl-ACP methyl ester carboxylesterase